MRARVAFTAALAATFLLAGCTGSPTAESEQAAVTDGMSVEGGAPAVPGDVSVAEEAPAVTTTVPTDREVIRTGYVSMRVDDVRSSAFEVRSLIMKRKGLISSEDLSTSGDTTYATITAQVPAAELDAFIADVSALGTVDSINVTAQDVTSQVVDLDARIRALSTSIDRLTELLAQATRIEDLLSIETQLAQRQSELDALTAQRTWLGTQVALSTLTVSLSPVTEIAEVDAPGFLSGLQSGWAAFVSLIMVAMTAIGFLLPFLVVLAVIAVPVTLVLVQQTRRHRRQRAEEPLPQDGSPPGIPQA